MIHNPVGLKCKLGTVLYSIVVSSSVVDVS